MVIVLLRPLSITKAKRFRWIAYHGGPEANGEMVVMRFLDCKQALVDRSGQGTGYMLTAELSPLIQCSLLLLAQFAAWRTIPADWRRIKLATRLILYVVYSYVLFRFGLNPLHAAAWINDPIQHFIAQIIELAWWYLSGRLVSLVANSLLFPQAWRKERLLEDVLGALAFIAAAIAGVAYVLELPVRGLLATSGAVAIVVGLAIQSTLSDVFSGIVLNATRPYQLGDFISVDGVDGRVIETSWRATQLQNAFGNIVTIPNTLAAKVKIVNLSRPSSIHGVSVVLHISPDARPSIVIETLHRAMLGCDLVLPAPQPAVVATTTDVHSIIYELTFYVRELTQTQTAKNQLFDLAFRHLAAAQIALRSLGYPTQQVNGASSCEMLLARVEIFKSFPSADITALAAAMVRYDYEQGATLARESDITDFLMVIASGVLSVRSNDAGGHVRQITKLGPGDSLGEAGVLTGVPLHAEVVADTNVTAYKLSKSTLTPFLKSNPDIARQMCSIIAKRRSAADVTLRADEPSKAADGLFQRMWTSMRSFHLLGD